MDAKKNKFKMKKHNWMLDVSRLNLFQCENKNLKNGVTALSLISFSA